MEQGLCVCVHYRNHPFLYVKSFVHFFQKWRDVGAEPQGLLSQDKVFGSEGLYGDFCAADGEGGFGLDFADAGEIALG